MGSITQWASFELPVTIWRSWVARRGLKCRQKLQSTATHSRQVTSCGNHKLFQPCLLVTSCIKYSLTLKLKILQGMKLELSVYCGLWVPVMTTVCRSPGCTSRQRLSKEQFDWFSISSTLFGFCSLVPHCKRLKASTGTSPPAMNKCADWTWNSFINWSKNHVNFTAKITFCMNFTCLIKSKFGRLEF